MQGSTPVPLRACEKMPRPRGSEKIRFLRPQVFGVRRFFAAFASAHTLITRSLKVHKAPLSILVDLFCTP